MLRIYPWNNEYPEVYDDIKKLITFSYCILWEVFGKQKIHPDVNKRKVLRFSNYDLQGTCVKSIFSKFLVLTSFLNSLASLWKLYTIRYVLWKFAETVVVRFKFLFDFFDSGLEKLWKKIESFPEKHQG